LSLAAVENWKCIYEIRDGAKSKSASAAAYTAPTFAFFRRFFSRLASIEP